MISTEQNINSAELKKFDDIAHEWWDAQGKFRTLHVINPLRMQFIESVVNLKNLYVLDIGCGGGLLCEAMAGRSALVTGIDASKTSITVANSHLQQAGLDVTYLTTTAEQFELSSERQFDAITCMEMLEHVPAPDAIIKAAARMLKPGGHLFLSTINRNLRSYLETVVAAEYLLNLIPAGTHEYSQYIRPDELCRWLRASGLEVIEVVGLKYMPFLHLAWLSPAPSVNYIVHARLPD